MQRTTKRFWLAIILLIVIALTLTACGGGGDEGQGIATRAVNAVAQRMPRIGLPRITVRYDQSGVPTIFGIRASSLARILPLDLSFVELPPDTINQLMASNVQHIELETNEAGLFVYLNGNALPYVAWDQDRLNYIGELIDRMDQMQYDETIAKAVPLLGKLGLDVVVTFPLADGAEEIPVRERSQRVLAEGPGPEEPTAVIEAIIVYSAEGVPSIADISTREVGQLLQTDLSAVELPPSTMTLLQQAGIQQALIVSQPDGLHLSVNERELLQVAYNEPHLMNAVDAYAQLMPDEQSQMIAGLLRDAVPIIYGADIDLLVEFPAGQ